MFELKKKYNIEDLRIIMSALRSENGCPWDKEQTHNTIRMDILEEAYEVMEAIDTGNGDLLKEELGDLLLQVVFHAQIETELNNFDFDDVCDGICKKLVYRHPHVFGELKLDSSNDVLKNWDKLKSKSKGEKKISDRLSAVPKLLPALMRGEKVIKRAHNAGFDFQNKEQVFECLKNGISKLENALSTDSIDENYVDIEEEFGDILFTCCNLGRFLKKDSEKALTSAINKFIMRFRAVEILAENTDILLENMPQEKLKELWEKAKDA